MGKLPNVRLKLAAPVVCGRIAFVPYSVAPQLRRDSLGCVISVLAVQAPPS